MSGVYIFENTPPTPPRGISANVIWEEKYKKRNEERWNFSVKRQKRTDEGKSLKGK
jgi:hypothetical protein